jgi:cell division protein FtsB
MPIPDPTNPEIQVRLMIGELLITIAQLEAQKATLQQTIEKLAAEIASLTPTPEEQAPTE